MATNKKALAKEPISSVKWIHRDEVKPNDYNPNKQSGIESSLLAESILADGWTQPIVITEDKQIVDGEHRYKVSGTKKMLAKYKGMIPTVQLVKSKADLMISTIRHNRARGDHNPVLEGKIMEVLMKENSFDDIKQKLGMSEEEVKRLISAIPFYKEITKDHEYSKAEKDT